MERVAGEFIVYDRTQQLDNAITVYATVPKELFTSHMQNHSMVITLLLLLKQNGGTAVDAVEKAVRVFEEHGYFNAGRGSCLNEDGEVECDAMIMDGEKMKTGTFKPTRLIQTSILIYSNTLLITLILDICRLIMTKYLFKTIRQFTRP